MHEVRQAQHQSPLPRRAPRCRLPQVEERRRIVSRGRVRTAGARHGATAAAATADAPTTAAGCRIDAPSTIRGRRPVEAVVSFVWGRRAGSEGLAPAPCATVAAGADAWEPAGRREYEPRWVGLSYLFPLFRFVVVRWPRTPCLSLFL